MGRRFTLPAGITRPNAARKVTHSTTPEALWHNVESLLSEIETWRSSQAGRWSPAAALGVASMAETGLIFDREQQIPRTPFIPWFDPVATPQAEALRQRFDVRSRFYRTGLRPIYKYSLPKIVWLKERQGISLNNAVWLGAADYIIYRLCGAFVTDTSLAGRTYAYCIDRKTWDLETLDQLGIPAYLFPAVLPSGCPAGPARPGLSGAWIGGWNASRCRRT